MRFFVLFVVVLLLTACRSKQIVSTYRGGPNTLSPGERALGWELLFDGKSMDEWRVFNEDGIRGWEVKEGLMTALGTSSPSADIITRDTFNHFELSLEWRVSERGNSGIFYNVREGEGMKAVYYTGPEYQILDEESYLNEIEDWQRTAANYAMHAPKIHVQKPRGTFNLSRIIVDEGHVQHWLNDRLVVSYTLWTDEWESLKQKSKWMGFPDYGIYQSGHIGIQDHGNQIQFRNIKIRRLYR